MAADIRMAHPESSIIINCGGGSIKSQMKRADRSNARLAIILAEDEINNNTVSVKFLREQRDQETLPQENLISFIDEYFRR